MGAHKGFGVWACAVWGVVWKEERLWERNRLHLNMLHFLSLLFSAFLLFFFSIKFVFLVAGANISLTARHLGPCMYMHACVCVCVYTQHFIYTCVSVV